LPFFNFFSIITCIGEKNNIILTDVFKRIYKETYSLSACELGRYPEEKWTIHKKRLKGGLGWLEGFNEWLCRCGIESFGPPGMDTIPLTLHGKVSNIPASRFGIQISLKKPSQITLWGEVHEASMFGTNLKLTTSITTTANSNTISITDTVQNMASTPQEFELLYHTNFGPPLLEEGSQFIAPVKKITPVNERAGEGLKKYHIYEKPTPDFVEQCYLFQMKKNRKGLTTVLLTNKNKDIASSITYSPKELPCFTIWKCTGALSDGYVTGLEPGTNYPLPRKVEREEGRLSKLRPGQKKIFHLNFSVHVGKKEVGGVIKK